MPDTRTDATRPDDHAGYRLERSLLLTIMSDAAADSDNGPQKQCRICLDGPEVEGELGRLIRPCLCLLSSFMRSFIELEDLVLRRDSHDIIGEIERLERIRGR